MQIGPFLFSCNACPGLSQCFNCFISSEGNDTHISFCFCLVKYSTKLWEEWLDMLWNTLKEFRECKQDCRFDR